MTLAVKPEITLHERRCWDCGRWWACESEAKGICPVCASRRIDAVLETQQQLERSLRSTRGALTRRRAGPR